MAVNITWNEYHILVWKTYVTSRQYKDMRNGKWLETKIAHSTFLDLNNETLQKLWYFQFVSNIIEDLFRLHVARVTFYTDGHYQWPKWSEARILPLPTGVFSRLY